MSERKPKSTGWRSTNSHFYGHCSDLAVQYNLRNGTRLDTEAMKRLLLIEMGEMDAWPGRVLYTRKGTPMWQPGPWADADAALANSAVDFCHAYADTEGYRLREYADDGSVEWVWYGKPKEKP